jgi:glycopeptide antibiotics resistance protein
MRSAGGRAGVDSNQRQPGRPSGWVRLAALVYVAALAVVTLLPIRWNSRLARWPNNYKPQLVPFDGILFGFGISLLETLAEAFGNVLLFAPFGFLLPLLVPAMRRWWRTVAAAAGVSLLIELYQLAWPSVRRADVNDLLMNALGALLGFAALQLTSQRRGGSSRRAPRSR